MMRRLLPALAFLFLLSLTAELSAQVGRSARIIPRRSFTLGIAPVWYPDVNGIALSPVYPDERPEVGLGAGITARYAPQYSMDMGAQIVYVYGGKPYFGADILYLAHEARYSYFSLGGGLHYWDTPGVDLRALYTYTPRFHIGLTAGLDMDVNYDTLMDNDVRVRVWLPVNVSIELSDMTRLWAEFNLQVSQLSWSLLSVGANFNFR